MDEIMQRIYNIRLRNVRVLRVRVIYDGVFSAEIDLSNWAGTVLGYGKTPEHALLDAEKKITYLRK